MTKNKIKNLVRMHTFNSSTQEAETGRTLEFEAILVYKASSRIVRDIQRNPVSIKQTYRNDF